MGWQEGKYKYEQIVHKVIHLIEYGTFRPGNSIPSVRQMSIQEKVSITTVLQAYYILEAQGYIKAHPKSGFYVNSILPGDYPEPDVSSPGSDPTRVSIRELIMMVLSEHLNTRLVHLGVAYPNTKLLPTEKLNRNLVRIGHRIGGESVQYSIPLGEESLRVQIARRLLEAGCAVVPDEIVITSGCSEAITLCLRAVCSPGNTVAVDSPISFDALRCLEALGLRVLEIPTHPRTGMRLDALRRAIEHQKIDACLTISNFNNPLGSCIPDEKKKEMADLLGKYEIPLIENDIFGEIYFTETRPRVVKAYDRKGLTMLCSSFSKDLCPGYRVGWVVPGRFKEEIEWLKYTSSLATTKLPQLAIAEFLASGSYDPLLRRIRKIYAQNLSALSVVVKRYFPDETRVTRPSGGFLLWVQLPDFVDSLKLYRSALQKNIAITPGYLFSATQNYKNFIRLNAANWSEEAEEAVKCLGEIISTLK